MLRWRIAIMVSVAIAINYLDRLTLPTVKDDIASQSGIVFTPQDFAFLNTAFLAAYGSMYLVGGKLMDFLGTRIGFALIMVFWSLACASHGIATGLATLVISRLLLGIGEGGGFPAATRTVAEWFPVKERSTAMGIINGGTGVGGVAALPLVGSIVLYANWLGIMSWRWVFFITGAMGLVWTFWWLWDYYTPETHPRLKSAEKDHIQQGIPIVQSAEPKIPLATLFQYRETWGIVFSKFLTDAAWYFILFWLPTYLRNEHNLNISKTMSVAWIPHAAAFVGCLLGGSLSSWLLHRQLSLNASRKLALFASAIVMPLLILVPYTSGMTHSTFWVIFLFSMGYFGQQSWSTLIMVLPADLFPKRAVGTVAGLVGLGGALGGIVLGQLSGYLLDNGFNYKPVMLIAGLLHVSAFVVILLTVRTIRPLAIPAPPATIADRALDSFELSLKVQIPSTILSLLGLIVVYQVMAPAGYVIMMGAGAACFAIFLAMLLLVHKRVAVPQWAMAALILAIGGLAAKTWVLSGPANWGKDQFFATCCILLSCVADAILLVGAANFVMKRSMINLEPVSQPITIK